jgi:hypothetical protein
LYQHQVTAGCAQVFCQARIRVSLRRRRVQGPHCLSEQRICRVGQCCARLAPEIMNRCAVRGPDAQAAPRRLELLLNFRELRSGLRTRPILRDALDAVGRLLSPAL